jgi:hypothetical protein
MVSDKLLEFDNKIGFVMSLTKNRITNIIESTAATPSNSVSSPVMTNLPGGVANGYTL